MVSKEQVLEALASIYDGEFHKSVVELRLVRDIMPKDDRVNLTFVLTTEDEHTKQQYEHDVKEALARIGVETVNLRFRMITEYEWNDLQRSVGQNGEGSAAGAVSGQKDGSQGAAAAGRTPATSPSGAGLTHYIAIASGKGGVGKSTVTVNLAVALARQGKRVGIIDADIYGFSVPDMMGIEENPQTEGDKILPVEKFGVKVMSMGFFVQDNAPIIWRGPMLGKMLKNFLTEVDWGELDYLLLDLPPGTGDVALDVHQMIPASKEIIVTTPHATAAFVAARAGAMAQQTGHEILGIVENMAYYTNRLGENEYVFGRGGGAKLAEELHAELLAQIPLGAPDNHAAEPDYSPSVYKADTQTGLMYQEVAARIVEKLA
ncbi:Mrp/NBP35 family ATP-binding protein [Gorillibacterium massiliense]|uniref:Mrp/NBP35 family ATP-binding protein n=1 Tax=Gorillibacterium massiliense TaxID=1280390 RepID=UPI0004AD6B3B|nr:Mrp/NBP35 family ATP-binding protein [Gorillibacterium massiliense]